MQIIMRKIYYQPYDSKLIPSRCQVKDSKIHRQT
jgi:hypothetical protein